MFIAFHLLNHLILNSCMNWQYNIRIFASWKNIKKAVEKVLQ